jgi:methionyl-tRNA formyltransferase
MRVLVSGTPAFAVPTLEALRHHHTVVAVVTQPDRPAHRGQRMAAPPVKARALAAGIPVVQPQRLRDPEWPDRLRAYAPDAAVVVAFGQILPRAVLDVPPRGSINVHASLLPKYRGAAPIAWAIIRGETETGVSIMQMDEGMDTGPVLLTARTPIGPDETAGELALRLAEIGARTLIDALARLDALAPAPQPHAQATLAPRLKKEDGHLDWSRSARELADLVRGCNPWPGGLALAPGGPLLVWRAASDEAATAAPPGTLVPRAQSLAIATGSGALLPREVQAVGRRVVAWQDYLRGARLGPGAVLGTP